MENNSVLASVASVPQWFREPRAGRELIEETSLAAVKTRAATWKRITALEAERVRVAPGLQKTVDTAGAELDKTQAAVRAAEGLCREAMLTQRTTLVGIEREISRLESALVQTADPRIDEFRGELRDMLDASRKLQPESQYGERKWSIVTGLPVDKVALSTQPSISARCQAIVEALHAAEALKAAHVEDVEAAIEKIRQTIPEVKMVAVSKD